VPDPAPRLVLVRHGETEWSRTRRHTGRTDLPLLPEGEAQARALRPLLDGYVFAEVRTSPLLRARRTCLLAGLGDAAVVDDDLVEWDYGAYEGRTTADIRVDRPGWDIFLEDPPGGETLLQVAERARRAVGRARAAAGDVAFVAHAHVLRVVATVWLDLPPDAARHFAMEPASVSVLGWERDHPVVMRWNA
jgi:probable phosphoglycerate mutase